MQLREIAAKHLNAAAIAQRADMELLNATLQKDLAAKGMVFNTPAPEPFRQKLRSAGFYSEWKSKFGSGGVGHPRTQHGQARVKAGCTND